MSSAVLPQFASLFHRKGAQNDTFDVKDGDNETSVALWLFNNKTM